MPSSTCRKCHRNLIVCGNCKGRAGATCYACRHTGVVCPEHGGHYS
jgi:hypothetical protein